MLHYHGRALRIEWGIRRRTGVGQRTCYDPEGIVNPLVRRFHRKRRPFFAQDTADMRFNVALA